MSEDNWMFLTASYVITWIVVVGYLIRLRRVMRQASDALDKASTQKGEV